MPTFPAYITATIAPRSRYIVGTPGSATLQIFAEPPVIPVGVGSLSNVGSVGLGQVNALSPVAVGSLCNVSAPTYTIAVPPDPTDLAWWKLNETSGTVAYDSTGNNRHATVTSPTWSDGLVGNGLGQGIAMFQPLYNMRTQPITMSGWFTPTVRNRVYGTPYYSPFPPNVLSNDNYGGAGIGIGFNVWTNGASPGNYMIDPLLGNISGVTIVAGTRYFFATIYGPTETTVYLNGAVVATYGVLNLSGGSGIVNEFRLNYHNGDTSYQTNRFAAGTLRDVRLYRRTLSPQDIQTLYTNGPAP